MKVLRFLDFQSKWSEKFENFVAGNIRKNATFALHADMMTHCDEVIAFYFAERMGGRLGYQLLLATVKKSLLFQFLNGASSYAPLCARLLCSYSKLGSFY